MLKLVNEEEIFPKICVCLDGETAISNRNYLLKSIISYKDKIQKKKGYDSYIDPYKLAYNNFKIPIGVKKEDEEDYELSVWILDKKENFEKSTQWLKEMKKKEKDKKKKEFIDECLEANEFGIHDNFAKKGKCVFRLKIKFCPEKEISIKSLENGDFIDKFTTIQDVLSLFKKINFEGNGVTCNALAFNSKEFSLLGDIKFPILVKDFSEVKKIPFADKLMERMGNPKLEAVTFSFDNSPIGLERISLITRNNIYIVPISFNYKTNKINDLIKKNYLHSFNIIKIFMRKRI